MLLIISRDNHALFSSSLLTENIILWEIQSNIVSNNQIYKQSKIYG